MKLRKRLLWWILLPALVVTIVIGSQYLRYHRQQAAIRQIEQLGGRVVTTHGDPRWMAWWLSGRSLRIFEQATIVNLSQVEMTDSDLILLRDLQGLQRLNLRGTRITDAGLRIVGRLTGLKALDLSDTAIGAAGLAHLRSLRELKYLYLHGTSLVDADLPTLQSSIPDCDIEHSPSLQ